MQEKGQPKKCWFIRTIDEAIQPLRLDAREVAKTRQTAKTVDFTTMYPNFDQRVLVERVREAVREAWEWEQRKSEVEMRVTRKGWVELGEEGELAWCMKDIGEMVEFVVDSGYVALRDGVWKQGAGVRDGFAMCPAVGKSGMLCGREGVCTGTGGGGSAAQLPIH